MRKALIIGLIVCVLAVGGIGAAFATGMTFTNVGALSLGIEPVPQVDCDYVGFHLKSAQGLPVTVDGVYLRFTSSFEDAAFSVSLRGKAWDGPYDPVWNDVELAYCAVNGYSQVVGTTACFLLEDDAGNLPTADQVFAVKVTVAGQGNYNSPPLNPVPSQ